ncbi:response regulator [Halorubellus sp. JP-L1]|uniref:response regulator n=1 Tax=Halorubellus sp. JP-L1 TaxID=2715753 RepID=UPI001F03BDCF|nr:response regulator [Halorubellus sp. JP-L1]
MTKPRVVCVDDEPSFADLTATHLERTAAVSAEGYTDPRDALSAIEDADDVRCVVSDYDMPAMNGLAFLDAVRERHPDLPFVLFTGKGSEQVASEAISMGVTEYLQKSTAASQYEVLGNRVENAIERYEAECALAEQRELVDRIVEATPVAIVVHDADGDVEVANERARELLSMDVDSLHLRSYDSSDWSLYAASGERLPEAELPVARVLDTGETMRAETFVVAVDGRRTEVALNAEPLVGDDGAIDRVVVVFAPTADFDGVPG